MVLVELRTRNDIRSWLIETFFVVSGWAGPDPVVYKSFDNLEGIILMEGTEQADFHLVQGQVFAFYLVNP